MPTIEIGVEAKWAFLIGVVVNPPFFYVLLVHTQYFFVPRHFDILFVEQKLYSNSNGR